VDGEETSKQTVADPIRGRRLRVECGDQKRERVGVIKCTISHEDCEVLAKIDPMSTFVETKQGTGFLPR
jgi:hypothetical protein